MAFHSRYKIVPGFPAYRVGTDGSIWSRHQHAKGFGVCRTLGVTWYRMNPILRSNGYVFVNLYNGDGKKNQWHLACVVLLAFVGPCPEGMEAAHKNGDSSDCRPANLRWATHHSNMQDRRRHRTFVHWGTHRKLSDGQVRNIRRDAANGQTQVSISKKYKVSTVTVGRIVRKKVRIAAGG